MNMWENEHGEKKPIAILEIYVCISSNMIIIGLTDLFDLGKSV